MSVKAVETVKPEKPQPRKINFDVVPQLIGGVSFSLKQQDGKPVDATLAEICEFVLNFANPAEQEKGDQKYALYKLGRKLENGGEIALQAQEIVLIKQKAAVALTAFAYGAICDILDPPAEE